MTEQGTQQWRDERAGHITASRIADVLTKPRKGQQDSATRMNYKAQLICERLNGRAIQDEYQSWDMRRGIELEPTARTEYELNCDADVETVGFVLHPKIAMAGASPDGLVGKYGIVQFKCPKRGTHLGWIMAGIVPPEYRPQMYFEMACTGREWADFVSYHPEFPDHLQLFVLRLDRDEAVIAEIETEVLKFNAEIEETISLLPSRESIRSTNGSRVEAVPR